MKRPQGEPDPSNEEPPSGPVMDEAEEAAEDAADEDADEEDDSEENRYPEPPPPAPRWRPHWLDVLLFILLVVFSSVISYQHASGDLWSDEADYALATLFGFEANRWDVPESIGTPEKIVAARHFHPPFTVDLIAWAHKVGADDRTIRMPFILIGGLAIGTVYLCGLALFDRRREIAAACAILVAISPAFIRMASHALPWSPIILELLLILLCMTEYANNRRWGWISGLIAVLGLLFITSEMFFVALLAVLVAGPFVLRKDPRKLLRPWPRRAQPDQPEISPLLIRPDPVKHAAKVEMLRAVGLGSAAFILLVVVFWPSGMAGESIKMLGHYMHMRHSQSFPVNVGSQIFIVAPRWSYLYWYWNDYRPFFVCYALGVPGLIVLAAMRRLQFSIAPLLSLTVFLLAAAHSAHIIGPEYLAHCLPFLTLLGGLFVYALSLKWRPLGAILLVVLALPFLRWSPRVPLPGMDARAQVSRWPDAARHLAPHWKTGDKIAVGSQPVSVAHWYLVYVGAVPPLDTQFQTLPVHAPKQAFLDKLESGVYRYVAVSNMFEDHVDLDPKTARILREWKVEWSSDEHGTGPSRLTIYRAPDRPSVAPEAAAPPPNNP